MTRVYMTRKVFLAHAREDKPQVRKLYTDLKTQGLEPWLDEIDLVPGQNWKQEIPKAIRQAKAFLACLSSRSVTKVGFVQSEFRLALSAFGERPPGSIFLIPVRLDECEIPDLQITDMGLSLKDFHYVDLWQEGGFHRLIAAIELASELAKIDPPPQIVRREVPTATAAAGLEARDRPAPAAMQEPRREEVRTKPPNPPKIPGVFLRNATIVVLIIGAMAAVATTLVPSLPEKHSESNGKSKIPLEERVETTSSVPMATTAEELLNLSTRDWQRVQQALGFDQKGVDGRPGPNTRKALADWQQKNSFSPSGYLTARQRDMLMSQAPQAEPAPRPIDYSNCRESWSASTISTFQRVLTDLGFDTVERDGILRENSRRSIQQYKEKYPTTTSNTSGGCLNFSILQDVLVQGRLRGIDRPVGYAAPGKKGGWPCQSGFVSLSGDVYEAPTMDSGVIGVAANYHSELQPARDGFCELPDEGGGVRFMLCTPC